ncbi:uncharacterized protein LOC141631942 [Silene latifolia]|uniref:uncharacterized protein LOC141631942 n=1 Tax=Silene latifolia TaxID=37657 RepID=UPI003D77D74C
MKKRKYKQDLYPTSLLGKSEKSSSSSSPHQTEPQSGVIDEIYTTQEEQVVPSEDTPQNETRANGSNVPINEEFVYDADLLPCDPGKRIPISSYPPNDQDMIRRGFISKGVFQPRNHSFPRTEFGTRLKPCKRHFKEAWYEKYNWLEYSIEKDAAFCFVCYLFKDKTSIPGTDKFVTDGFKGWNRAHERFRKHIGNGVRSAHKEAQEKYDFFNSPKSSIIENFNKTSKEVRILYKASYLSF